MVALGITLATAGMGSGAGLSIGNAMALGSGTTGVLSTMSAAGFSALCSQSALLILQHEGDLGKAAQSLASDKTLKNVVMSMATAGLTKGITGSLGINTNPSDLSKLTNANLLSGITAHLKHQAIGGMVRGGVDVMGGQDPTQALRNQVRSVVAGVIGAVSCNTIGHAYGSEAIDGLSHKLLHGIVGGIEGAILDGRDGITAGALGAIVSESLVEVIVPNLTELSMEAYEEGDTTQQRKQLLEDKLKGYTDRATLITAATLCGLGVEKVDTAITTATTAVENNFVLQAIGLGLTVFEMVEAYQEGGLNQALITGVTGAALSIIGAKGISMLTKTPRMVELLGKISAKATKARSNVWKKAPLERGNIIEKELGQNLHQNFPVIDRFEKGVVTSIKSLDLNAKTYQNASNLKSTLHGYIDKVSKFETGTVGKQIIKPHEFQKRALDFAVPHGGNTAQQKVIQDAIAYAKSKDVVLNIIKM